MFVNNCIYDLIIILLMQCQLRSINYYINKKNLHIQNDPCITELKYVKIQVQRTMRPTEQPENNNSFFYIKLMFELQVKFLTSCKNCTFTTPKTKINL